MSEIAAIVLLVLSIPVIAIAALVVALKARERVWQLQLRIEALEAGARPAPAIQAGNRAPLANRRLPSSSHE